MRMMGCGVLGMSDGREEGEAEWKNERNDRGKQEPKYERAHERREINRGREISTRLPIITKKPTCLRART